MAGGGLPVDGPRVEAGSVLAQGFEIGAVAQVPLGP
jgi:hypothetical protein